MTVSVSVASGNYDRIRALRDGAVRVEGCAIDYHVVEPNQLFVRNLKRQEFDVSEMSFSTYITHREQGRAHYTAIPVFPSRAFRHSAIFVRASHGANERGGIASPADLVGRRVGTPEYFTTMLVWMRGLLADEYGIMPSDLRWRIGGLEQPAAERPPPYPPPQAGKEARPYPPPQAGEEARPCPPPLAGEKARLHPPPLAGESREGGIEIEAIPPGKTLSDMLAAGEIDALFSARPPSCFLRGEAVRMFPDYRAAEQAYFRKTGVYPLMHAVGIRNTLLAAHPWLAARFFAAFSRAKDMAIADLEKLSAFAVSLPWIEAEYRAAQAVLGKDVWPYGIDANRKAIETLCRYLHEQGFTKRRMGVEELFAPMAAASGRDSP
jgi:4,5-dihydroxyphthalate decarboxylase